jgi:hypothetical protein
MHGQRNIKERERDAKTKVSGFINLNIKSIAQYKLANFKRVELTLQTFPTVNKET